jgi:hypothetical protein
VIIVTNWLFSAEVISQQSLSTCTRNFCGCSSVRLKAGLMRIAVQWKPEAQRTITRPHNAPLVSCWLDASKTTRAERRLTVNLAPLLNGSPKSADGTALSRFHFATDLAIRRQSPAGPIQGRKEMPPRPGNQALRLILHQTFAIPDRPDSIAFPIRRKTCRL